jgi:type IV pilus assembly protein PilE
MHTYKVRTGFTLLELMIVIVIVSMLAMIAIPTYSQYTRKAQRAAAQSQMLKIAADLERWRGKALGYKGFVPETGYETATNTTILLPKGSSSSNFMYRITLLDIACRNATVSLNPAVSVAGCTGQGWVMIARPNSGDATDTNTSTGIMGSASRLVLDSQGVRCMTPGTTSDHISDALIATASVSDAALCGVSSAPW